MNINIDLTHDTKLIDSTIAANIIALGASRHYYFRVVGSGPVPTTSFLKGLWRVVPHSEPPLVIKPRVDLIRSGGFEIKGYVVIHEPSIAEPEPIIAPPPQRVRPDSKTQPIISTDAVGEILAAGLAGGLALAVTFFAAAFVDPSFVVVCGPENVWIEVMNDYE